MALPLVVPAGITAARVAAPYLASLVRTYGPRVLDALVGGGAMAYGMERTGVADKLLNIEPDVVETGDGIIIVPPKGLSDEEKKKLGLDGTPVGGGTTTLKDEDKLPTTTAGDMPEVIDPSPPPFPGTTDQTLKDLIAGGGFTPTDMPDMSILNIKIPSNKELEKIRKEMNENFKKANREDFEKYPGNVQNALIKKGFNPEGAFELGYKDFPLEMKYAILEGRMDVPTRYFDDYQQLSFEDRIKTNLMIDFGDQFKPVIKNEKIASFERIKDINLPDISKMRTLSGYTALDGVNYTNPYVIEEMIKLDRQTIRDQRNIPDPDATRKQNFSDRYKNKVYDIYKYGIQDKQGNTLVEAKIPDLVKGHEANRYKREELGERELEQVTYPTFYTNTWRNQKHKILEGDEATYKKELKKLTATKESREKNADRIQEINTAISLIGKDLETLLLPTTRLDEKTGKFRFSGKYTANPKELLDSINSEKKLFYFGSEFDLKQKERMKTSYKDFDFTTETINGVETHVASLPKGFSKGGIVDIRKMIRPINAQR